MFGWLISFIIMKLEKNNITNDLSEIVQLLHLISEKLQSAAVHIIGRFCMELWPYHITIANFGWYSLTTVNSLIKAQGA